MKRILLPFLLAAVASASAVEPKVLLIGIDGLRPDALAKANTPNIDKLIAEGGFSPKTVIQRAYKKSDTASGPGWSSILTGVWADKHGVHDNSFVGKNFTQFPPFFTYVKQARPEAKIATFVSWPEIDRHIIADSDLRHLEKLPPSAASPVNLYGYPAFEGINTRDGQWHHLVGQREGKNLVVYLDGKKLSEIDDNAEEFFPEGMIFHVGRAPKEKGDTTFKDGEIGAIRIWGRTLTGAEIAALASQEKEQSIPEGISSEELLAQCRGVPSGDQLLVPVMGGLEPRKKGDFAVEVWFKTTNPERSVLLSNYESRNASAAMVVELSKDNSVKFRVQPVSTVAEQMEAQKEMDKNNTDRVVKWIREENPSVVYAYFHQVDAAGHTIGFSPEIPEYVTAIENVDQNIGRLLDAVRSRPNFAEEDWLVVVCSDHGGIKKTHGNGQEIPEILYVPLVIADLSHPQQFQISEASLVDVAPTILSHLNIPIDPKWQLDGKPLKKDR